MKVFNSSTPILFSRSARFVMVRLALDFGYIPGSAPYSFVVILFLHYILQACMLTSRNGPPEMSSPLQALQERQLPLQDLKKRQLSLQNLQERQLPLMPSSNVGFRSRTSRNVSSHFMPSRNVGFRSRTSRNVSSRSRTYRNVSFRSKTSRYVS